LFHGIHSHIIALQTNWRVKTVGKWKNRSDDGRKKRLVGKMAGIPTNLTAKSRRFESRAHLQLELSPVFVRNVSEPGYYCDGNGLYLQVAPGGSKSWVCRTTIHGKRHEIGLGGLAYTSLSDAREKAIQIRKSARNGGDPLMEKRERRKRALREANMPVFRDAAKVVHAEHSKTFRNPKHAAQWITTLETYVFPHIGNKRVDSIESGDVLKVLSPIWLGKSETAARIKQRMKTVFDWAIAAGHRTAGNPCGAITKVLPKHNGEKQHFAALHYDEVPTFICELRNDAGVSGRLAFEFLILCAARTGEVIQATWKEVDFAKKLWARPASHMKAKKEHQIPLTPRAIEILRKAKQISDGSECLFPGLRSGLRSGHPLSNMTFNMTRCDA